MHIRTMHIRTSLALGLCLVFFACLGCGPQRVAAPVADRQAAETIRAGLVVAATAATGVGEVASSGAGWATLRYMHLSFMPAVGFGIAVTSIVGRNIGAGRPDIAVARASLCSFIAAAAALRSSNLSVGNRA